MAQMNETKPIFHTTALSLLSKASGETIIAKLVAKGYSVKSVIGERGCIGEANNAVVIFILSITKEEATPSTISEDISLICDENKLKFYSFMVYESSPSAFQLGNMILPKEKPTYGKVLQFPKKEPKPSPEPI